MNERPDASQESDSSSPEPSVRSLHWGGIWLGLVAFGGASFGAYGYGVGRGASSTAIVLVLGTLVAAAASFAAGFRSFALGLLAGYGVMTIVSGGACTLTFADPLNEGGGALVGVVVYPVFVFVFGIVAAVVHARRQKVQR